MIRLIIGLLLILIPFLLVRLFEDKKKGFIYIFTGLIGFHLVIALATQAFHIFSYNLILLLNVILCFFVIFFVNKRMGFKNLKFNFKKIKIDWMLIFILIVLIIELGSVHFSYTGKLSTAVQQYRPVQNIRLDYPYYSDEWSAVSVIKYSINTGSLGLKNPLAPNADFNNMEIGFHSFLSEIILLLGLNPLSQYSFLSLFFGILICLLVYYLLRFNNLDKFYSGVACLFIPFIVNSSNLPGLWYLIPLDLGIVSMLLGYIFLSLDNKKAGVLISLLVLIFYPPLFVFYSLSLFFYFIFSNNSKKTKLSYIGIYFGLVLFCALILFFITFYVNDFSFVKAISFIFSKISYDTFTENAIPDYSILKIIPIPILIISSFGLFINLKNKKRYWLISPIFVGLIYWIIYSNSLWRFIIEYQRVVFVTSILIVSFSGFGLEFLFDKLKKFRYFDNYHLLTLLKILLLIFLFLFSFYYTQRTNWMELKLNYVNSNKSIMPNAPASNYLTLEDLKLFKDIHQKKFLTIPWKGLVIGVATENYPLYTKSSTLSVNILTYQDFMVSDCNKKKELAVKYKLDYVYSEKFECSYFQFINSSSEGLNLYKFIKN